MIRKVHSRSLPFFLAILCLLFCNGVLAQTEQGKFIHLKKGVLAPVANAARYLDSISPQVTQQPVQVLMHFSSLPTAAQRQALKQSGVTLLDYLPDNTFSAILSGDVDKEQILTLPVHSIISQQPEWKADDFLWQKAAKQKGAVEVLVSFWQGLDASDIRQFVASMGGQINAGAMEKYGCYKVIIPAASLHSLAQWYGVRYISPVTKMVPLDLESRPAIKGNVAAALPIYGGFGLKGDSVTVGVGDDGSGIYHADLQDRVINFNPARLGNHGEHVNGIVGGANISDPLAAGMAPHVSLVDYLFDQVLFDEGPMYRDYNMTITNNSYELIEGDCAYTGTYDVYSQFLDTMALGYPYVQNVFASGNDGYLTCSPYPPGFGTVGGGYQPAKNIIVVGSMTDYLLQASDESRGPVIDGRIKPEIVATGLGAYSTVGVDQYEWAAGTSMASPHVAGGLALLTQRYKQLNNTQPRADLLKAVALNGAMDAGNPGPDYAYGFGIMDLVRSLDIINNNHFHSDTISTGDSQSVTISVPPNTGQLKVMLYWNDVPASPYSSKQLVNDLDLVVKSGGTTHLPLVPNPSPAHVNDTATEQADHINNVEQVTINSPQPGPVQITVKGYSIPYGPQNYVIAYDFVPQAVRLTYPIGGEQIANSMDPFDSLRIFWDAVTDGNSFTVQLSQDNGGSWYTIANNVPPDIRRCDFIIHDISSGKCRVRVSRNNTSEVSTSQRFAVNTPPTVHLDSAQCPGYINIHWSPVLNATRYYLLRKIGNYMQVVDSVADTVYSFSGMPLHSYSYVAVQPIIDGIPGYRSLAIKTMADSGNCTNPVSNGDIMIEKLASPNAGRMYTSTDFSTGASVRIKLRTLYNAPCPHYTLSYRLDGGSWATLTDPGTIPANDTIDITLPALSLTLGAHTLNVAVHNTTLPDPQHDNDTLTFVLTRLPNDTINLSTPFFDGFEAMSAFGTSDDSMGVSPDGRWDYFHTGGYGRMRSFVKDNVTISGTRSISLDQDRNFQPADKNSFIGTFNFSNYDTATTEIRMDFDYILHGAPKSPNGNAVSIRANDTMPWSQFFAYDLAAYQGTLLHARSLSLTDAMRQGHKNFSSSCQVSFGQSDTSLIASVNYGNGLTIDNVKLYTVANDAAMVSIVSPLPSNCGLSSPQPLTIRVHNGVNTTLHNVQVFFRADNGPVYSGTIDSILPKATIDYTFTQPVSALEGVTHRIHTWLKAPGDTYTLNDSLLNYHYRNNVIVSSFPYLENFEQGDGGYYSDGFKNSWQYGSPSSQKINRAASGVKAWKTNLTGNYNNLELSYLYSPCFDISGLANPMLSFSAAMDIENCGNTLCDAAWVECSFDGLTWLKLGSAGSGTNWYDSTFNVWNTKGFTRWHVASVPLPQPGPGVIMHLRFVLAADPGVTYEGLAVDDIHIFDLNERMAPANGVLAVSQDLSGDQWTDFSLANKLLASVEPRSQSVSNTGVTLYAHDTIYNPGATQYTLDRSYTIKASQSPQDSIGIRLFLADSEVVMANNDTTCPSCNHFPDAYSLGITQYDNPGNKAIENGSLADDTGGVFTYYPYRSVQWVPYDNGYYAQLNVKPFSEFWFNDGGPAGNLPAGTDYLNFIAYRNGDANVTLSWYSLIDTLVNTYTPQWSLDGVHFADVLDTPAEHVPVGVYSVNDPVNFSHASVIYFRLRWTMTNNDAIHYSPVRRVEAADSVLSQITFDAQMVSHQNVQLSWTSFIDGFVSNYTLQRAIGNNSFTSIATIGSMHRYGQQYTYIDQPGSNIATGTVIHYRLLPELEDNTILQLPERTVEWVSDNSIVNVYPNPTYDGTVSIIWHADAGVQMHINILDALGRSVFESTVVSSQWTNTTTVHSLQHPNGVYFIRLDINGRRYTRKVVYVN